MMQFYQKNNFGPFINDTFTFFKVNGKNDFKNNLQMNGLMLILMVTNFVLGYREIFLQTFGSSTGGQRFYLSELPHNLLEGTSGILPVIIYGIILLISFWMVNIILVNLGLQDDDNRTDLHRNFNLIGINSIGTHEV